MWSRILDQWRTHTHPHTHTHTHTHTPFAKRSITVLTCGCFSVNCVAWFSVFSSCESSDCRKDGLAATPFSVVFSEFRGAGGWVSAEMQPIRRSVSDRNLSHRVSSSRERCLCSSFSSLRFVIIIRTNQCLKRVIVQEVVLVVPVLRVPADEDRQVAVVP